MYFSGIQRSVDPNLKNLLCQSNNLSEEGTNKNENLPNCNYIDLSYFSNLDKKLKMSLIFPSQSGPILKFKGNVQCIQKGHHNMAAQVDMIFQN